MAKEWGLMGLGNLSCVERNLGKLRVTTLLSLWFFLSAFYYLGNFLSGEVIVGLDESLVHKLLKYFFALFVCSLFLVYKKLWNLLFFYVCLSFFMVFFVFFGFDDLDVVYPIALLSVVFSFIGFTYISAGISEHDLSDVLDCIVLSAFLVSLISFYEYFFMWPILGGYWEATGGYRSISTLLNPNNLGVYLGAALIILILRPSFSPCLRVLVVFSISAALLMSGSRTAVVSLFMPVFIGAIFNGLLKSSAKLLLVLFLPFLGVLIGLILYASGVEGLGGRFSDMQTASIRLDKYGYFLSSFDYSYFFPDFSSSRFFYVSESSYFHFVNAFGLLVSFLFVLLLLCSFRPDFSRIGGSVSRKALFFVFIYYLIVFLFENALVSFPNNQLFFFAAGALLRPVRFSIAKV